jgi:hypothetical protein
MVGHPPVRKPWAKFGLLALVLALSTAGCSFLGGASKTVASLGKAGYRGVGIDIETGTGLPRDGLVDLSYSAGPTGNADRDAYNAAHIVWETLRYRFGALEITQVSGGCAGPLCVSDSKELGQETYAQMLAQFGPRPARLNLTTASNAVGAIRWAIPVVLVVVVLGAIGAVAVIVVLIVRGRRRPAPWVMSQPAVRPPPILVPPPVPPPVRGGQQPSPPAPGWQPLPGPEEQAPQ